MMDELSNLQHANIARPYALAAFEVARERNDLPNWKTFLQAAALVAKDKKITSFLADPEVTRAKLHEMFRSILESFLDKERDNFLSLLIEKNRLNVLPGISALFSEYYAQQEKISTVKVTTAVEPEDVYKQKLQRALTKRLQREVILQYHIDPSILGGAILQIGDKVIDGSIRGKLARLLEFSLR